MNRTVLAVIVCFVIVALLALLYISSSVARHRLMRKDNPPEENRLTRVVVTGDANAQAQPDTAEVVISVVTQSQRALDAQQQNARKSDAVINSVKSTAGANPEIRTSDYSLQPQRSYRENRLPTIIGYEARNTVAVRISDLNKVGAVIDAASQAGANGIERVSFLLRKDDPERSQALAQATQQAMGKAHSIAQSLGGRVVGVVEEREGIAANDTLAADDLMDTRIQADRAATIYSENMAMAYKRVPTAVEAGSLNIKSQVKLVAEIEIQP